MTGKGNQNAESDANQRDAPPLLPHGRWRKPASAIALAVLLLCGAAGIANQSFVAFFKALGLCGLPVLAVVVLFATLATAGKRPRSFCGFCGYDRTGFGAAAPCPECGKDATFLGAPGHRAVGHRTVPAWLWVPIVLAPFSPVLLGPITGGRYMEEVFLGVGAFMLLLLGMAGWHAWNQGRSAP